jgi:hypothetical protein
VTFTTPASRPEPDEFDERMRLLNAERQRPSRLVPGCPLCTGPDTAEAQAHRRDKLEAVVGPGEYGGNR